MSNTTIADAIGVSPHTVIAVRDDLGINHANARLKGADGKMRPAKMKREPRGEPDEPKEKDEPPPDYLIPQ